MKKTGSPQWRPPTCGSAVTSGQPRRHILVSNTVTLSPRKGARLVQDVAGGALPANCANSPLSCILAVRRPRRHPPRLVRRPPRRPPATNTSCHAHPGVHRIVRVHGAPNVFLWGGDTWVNLSRSIDFCSCADQVLSPFPGAPPLAGPRSPCTLPYRTYVCMYVGSRTGRTRAGLMAWATKV